jgi:hypothetical protein
VRRWIAPALALVAVGLIPWTIWLTTELPSHEDVHNWDLAWGGLDLMLAAALAATAFTGWRRDPLLRPAAASTATLLVVDAWFDLLTARGHDFAWALVLAAVAELPLAALCIWIVFRYKAEPQPSASARSRP